MNLIQIYLKKTFKNKVKQSFILDANASAENPAKTTL